MGREAVGWAGEGRGPLSLQACCCCFCLSLLNRQRAGTDGDLVSCEERKTGGKGNRKEQEIYKVINTSAPPVLVDVLFGGCYHHRRHVSCTFSRAGLPEVYLERDSFCEPVPASSSTTSLRFYFLFIFSNCRFYIDFWLSCLFAASRSFAGFTSVFFFFFSLARVLYRVELLQT